MARIVGRTSLEVLCGNIVIELGIGIFIVELALFHLGGQAIVFAKENGRDDGGDDERARGCYIGGSHDTTTYTTTQHISGQHGKNQAINEK